MNRPTPLRGKNQPGRDAVLPLPQLHLTRNAVLEDLLARLRDIRTPGPEFAAALAEMTRFLLWQALSRAPLAHDIVPGHDGETVRVARLESSLAAVAILRAGLAMVPPLRVLAPGAPIYQVGVHRDEATLAPTVYHSNLPASLAGVETLLILDPMLATAGSALATLDLVRAIPSFSGRLAYLGIIGAPLGVQRLAKRAPGVEIYLAALDERLDEHGYIVPGLGDAGDRIFGTSPAG